MGKLVVDDILGDLSRLSGTGLTDKDEDLRRVVLVEKFLPMMCVSSSNRGQEERLARTFACALEDPVALGGSGNTSENGVSP